MGFDELEGKEFKFYGVDNNSFKLDRKVWLAVEDEDDGYRSYLDSIEVLDSKDGIFFRKSLAKVRIYRDQGPYFEGFMLIDVEDGHCWLRVGTDNADDYYPYFVFQYQPKKR